MAWLGVFPMVGLCQEKVVCTLNDCVGGVFQFICRSVRLASGRTIEEPCPRRRMGLPVKSGAPHPPTYPSKPFPLPIPCFDAGTYGSIQNDSIAPKPNLNAEREQIENLWMQNSCTIHSSKAENGCFLFVLSYNIPEVLTQRGGVLKTVQLNWRPSSFSFCCCVKKELLWQKSNSWGMGFYFR